MFGAAFAITLFTGLALNYLLGVGLLVHFISFVKGKTLFGDWFGFWAAGLVLSFGGLMGFFQGGIWAILLGTILYIIAALRSRHRQVPRAQA